MFILEEIDKVSIIGILRVTFINKIKYYQTIEYLGLPTNA